MPHSLVAVFQRSGEKYCISVAKKARRVSVTNISWLTLFEETVALGGLVVIVLAIGVKVREFKPAWPSHVVEFYSMEGNRDSSVSIVSEYRLDGRGLIPGRGKGFFPLASVSRPALRPSQPRVQWVPGVISRG
jgi:hypothetical protein